MPILERPRLRRSDGGFFFKPRSGWALLVLAATALLGLIVAQACVPADTRPVPTELNVMVSPSDAVAFGTTTADGWSITFDRVLVGIGGTSLGDGCTEYSEASYDRVLDVTFDAGQKLSQLHALGQCDFRFRIGPPAEDALLGVGVAEDDKTRMRTPGVDPYSVPLAAPDASTRAPSPSGIGAEISLTARRGGVTKRLRLVLRSRIRYQRCSIVAGGGPSVYLTEGDTQAVNLRIEAESILRDDDDAGAALRFDPFAEADVDGDGEVTLDELRAVPLAKARDGGGFEAGTYDVDDAGQLIQGRPIAIESLGDFVYLVLAPLIPRFRDIGRCVGRRDRRAGNGGGILN